MTHKVGATVQVAAKQGSQFDGEVGRVTKRLTKDSAAVIFPSKPLVPALMFGDNELLPFVGTKETTTDED